MSKTKCLGKDRNNDPCRNNIYNNTKFCELHDYMCEYSDDMLNNLTLCSGCKKMYYLSNTKICVKCKNRKLVNKLKEKQEIILCKKEGCNYKQSEENEYCGKHQADYFKEQTELENKKVCSNYTRGCRGKLDLTYKYSKCQPCLEKDRIYEKNYNNLNKVNKSTKYLNQEENLIKIENTNNINKDKKSLEIYDNINKIILSINELEKNILEIEENFKDNINVYQVKKIKINNSIKEIPVFLCSNKYHWKQGKDFVDLNNKCWRHCNQCREKSRNNDKIKAEQNNNDLKKVNIFDNESLSESEISISSKKLEESEESEEPEETDKKLQIIRNKNNEKKQRQREKLKEELGEEEYNKINAEKMRKYRESIKEKNNIQPKIIKTPEQIREEARLRKQKSREKKREQLGEEEYKKLRADELAEYRKNKKT